LFLPLVDMRPQWTKRFEWISAFDRIPLIDTLNKLRDLDLFDEKELADYFSVSIRRRLWQIFGPDELPKPVQPAKVKARPKSPKRRPADQPARMAA
jgi:hypothetical protein